MRDQGLDEALLAAHQAEDSLLLTQLYQQAAGGAFAQHDIDAGCFYLTHAYIFGLESQSPDVGAIHQRLKDYGRET